MLSLGNDVHYVHEPFNPRVNVRGFQKLPIEKWFQYIDDSNSSHFVPPISKILEHNYSFVRDFSTQKGIRRFFRVLNHWKELREVRRCNHRVVMKDPIAIFATEWLAREFNMQPVVTIRHPAAFVSSIVRLGWRLDLVSDLLAQRNLMENYLAPYETEIADSRKDDDLVSQASLLWKLFYHTVSIFQSRHPSWVYVKHEDLSQAPGSEFKKIFAQLDLDFTPQIESRILEHSSSSNPKEIEVVGEKQRTTTSIKVDSTANISSWSDRLDSEQILAIRNSTEEVAQLYYTDADWNTETR